MPQTGLMGYVIPQRKPYPVYDETYEQHANTIGAALAKQFVGVAGEKLADVLCGTPTKKLAPSAVD